MVLLYLLEYNIIYKVGGVSNPYASMEWPRIHIPQVISTMLRKSDCDSTSSQTPAAKRRETSTSTTTNPADRRLDFAENPDPEEDFLNYAVELHCLNPVQDIA